MKRNKRRKRYKWNKRKLIRNILVLICIVAACVLAISFSETAKETIEDAAYPRAYHEEVAAAAAKYEIEEALIFAVIRTESHFNSEAVSHAQATGLMQITASTYFFINEKDKRGDLPLELLYDPAVNIDSGTFYLKWLIDNFGNVRTAIAAYNAGPTQVRKWLSDPAYSSDGVTLDVIPYKETDNYVKKVYSAYEMYRNLYYS